jgi:predicted SprT family Zn-dependent metalloprotease
LVDRLDRFQYNTDILKQQGLNEMQAQIEAIRSKVQECIARAEAKFGVKMPRVDVRFDLEGRAAGMAGHRWGQFYLRFNRNHMQLGGKTWEHLLNDTVPHEVAHTVCQAFPKFGRNHDQGWKRVCIALGGSGQRCYSEEDAPEAIAAQRPWVYITTNGNEVRVTKVIHSKIQQGMIYTFRGGKGQVSRQCQYNYMTAPAVDASKKPVVVNTPAPLVLSNTKVEIPLKRPALTAGVSKADQVRARIQQARAQGESAAVVVQWAVTELGMSLSLAKTYVKNNWAKA